MLEGPLILLWQVLLHFSIQTIPQQETLLRFLDRRKLQHRQQGPGKPCLRLKSHCTAVARGPTIGTCVTAHRRQRHQSTSFRARGWPVTRQSTESAVRMKRGALQRIASLYHRKRRRSNLPIQGLVEDRTPVSISRLTSARCQRAPAGPQSSSSRSSSDDVALRCVPFAASS